MLALALITLGIICRFIPHLANYSPLLAIALFSGVYLKRRYAVLLPLALMMVTDLFLGLHNAVLFTWGSILIIALLGTIFKSKRNAITITSGAIGSSVLFFIITNFGVWLMGWYPRTAQGLIDCYVMGIPFFRTTLLSTLVYSALLFGAYELAVQRIKKEELRKVLLTN